MSERINKPRFSIRCSSLPLLMRCAAAAQRPKVLIHETNPQAETGTDAHEHLRTMIEMGDVDWQAIRNPEVRGLVASGRRMWRDHLRELFPAPMCERSLSVEVSPGIVVTGHTDVQSGMVGTCRVLDWKSGRVDSDYSSQLLGYAALAMLENHAIDRVETHIGWIRDNEIENYAMDRSELPDWCHRIEQIAAWSGSYQAGPHCEHCPRSHECPGANAIARKAVAAVRDLDIEDVEDSLANMPPERVIEVVRLARMVERTADRVVKAGRALVERRGDIVAPDGSRLTLTSQRKRSVDAFAAWPVLQQHLDDRELSTVVDVRLSKLEEAVAKKAPPRGGAAAKRELARQLEEVDAVRFTETKILKERRT